MSRVKGEAVTLWRVMLNDPSGDQELTVVPMKFIKTRDHYHACDDRLDWLGGPFRVASAPLFGFAPTEAAAVGLAVAGARSQAHHAAEFLEKLETFAEGFVE